MEECWNDPEPFSSPTLTALPGLRFLLDHMKAQSLGAKCGLSIGTLSDFHQAWITDTNLQLSINQQQKKEKVEPDDHEPASNVPKQ